MRRRLRLIRKDSIFRFYLALFALGTAFGMYAVVSAQGASNKRVVAALEKRIAELEARPVVVENPEHRDASSTTEEVAPESPLARRAREIDEELFWVEGHGFNKRYAYLDLQFRDGYRARYYFRPFPSRGELVSLHRRIEHDALSHYFPVDNYDES